MNNKLEHKLNKRIEEGTYRSLSSFDGIDFWSNDYLGLSQFPTETAESLLKGSTGSRLISGNSGVAEKCESFLADFFNDEAALVFNSGYDANIGIFSSIPQKGDLVIYDEKIHASVRDGIRLSFAKATSFIHSSLEDLEKKLQLPGEIKYVAIESLYSMDGDLAPIVPILNLCDKYNALLIVDEAHSAGVFGENGRGVVSAFNVENRVFARLVTFGKAYGSHGAAVLCSELTKKFLVNFARSFIYTTALPPESFNRIQKLVNQPVVNERSVQLMSNIRYFRELTSKSSFKLLSEVNSPIQMVKIGSIQKTNELASRLKQSGFAVKAIFSPTVSVGEESIRICIHSFNTKADIQRLTRGIG